ncbi:MAG: S-layer homology domain-containing protein, partial [Thermaerobacter sp.]|nr:S-layer homology domain-containing protein [Thermaerobacter sp.]
ALPQPASPIAFADVSRGSWEYQPVEAASPYYDYYQLPGGGFAFHPDQGFDRQDVATVIVRILVKSGKLQLASSAQTQAILAKFTDASDIAPSLQPYVTTAVQAGIMAGFPDGSFQPQTVLNRAQVAAVLLKLQNYFVVTGS